MSDILLFYGGILVFALLCFFSYRNGVVYDIRTNMLSDTDYEDYILYDTLPEYEAMLYNPMYYHLWSYDQWKQYVISKV